ncbi:MAG: hypothetical protein BIFFINMI_01053 [Phycisphaerae bacterium]|nr:hypothetical protein [Phycisphaerae bacterium]
MRHMIVAAIAAVCLSCCPVFGADARFTAAPQAQSLPGGGARVSFTLVGPSDVEVAVLDAGGNIVRRLAAGLVGGEKVAPPLKAGLAQELIWDGKDDLGKPIAAATGPFKVRVRAGVGVKFGRFIGQSPYVFGGLCSIAADEAGNVYMMGYTGNRNQHMRTIRVFDTQGRYLRTLMPFPADLSPDGMKDVAAWDEQAKAFRPRNLTSLNPEFYGGNLTIVSASSRDGLILSDGASVSRLDARGGVPGDKFVTGQLWGKDRNPNTGGGPLFLAASPDGKFLYLGGPYSSKTKYGHPYIDKFPPGRIYRLAVGGGGTSEPFADIAVAHNEGVGGAWTKGNKYQNDGVPEGPIHGLACDAKGNLYVCDWENQRIAIFDAAGKLVGQVKVECPHNVAVHPRTGEIYVLSRHCSGYWTYKVWVSKFPALGGGDGQPLARYDFPQQKTGMPSMALAASADATSLFFSGVTGDFAVLSDAGSTFEPAKVAFAQPPGALDVYNRMEVDPRRDEVYISDGGNLYARFDGQTGEGGRLEQGGKPFHATDLAVGYDGLLYCQTGEGFSGPLERLTRDLAPAPYAATGTHVLSKYIYGRYGIGNCEKGIGVGPDGKVYVAWMFGGWVKYAVSGWDGNGRPMNGSYSKIDESNHKGGTPAELTNAIIGPIPQCNGGVRVDLQGNIYVGMIVGKTPTPDAFAKDRAYQHCTGSIVKFTPDGGTVPGGDAIMTGDKVEGAVAVYPGLSPFSHPSLGTTCCVCRVPRFDVDRYGRLAIPNATGNYVTLVDNAGNELLNFGKYGNFDSQYVNPNAPAGQAGKPTVATPDIPLGWPNCAGMSDRSVYVLDIYNRRVVRADLTWAAEATADLK